MRGRIATWPLAAILPSILVCAACLAPTPKHTFRVAIANSLTSDILADQIQQFVEIQNGSTKWRTDQANGVCSITEAPNLYSRGGWMVTIRRYNRNGLFDAASRSSDGSESEYDLLLVDDPWLPALKSGLSSLPVRNDADYPSIVSSMAMGVAIPYSGNVQIFGFNKRLLGTQNGETLTKPTTWPAMIEMIHKLRVRQGTQMWFAPLVMRMQPQNPLVTDFLPILWSTAPSLLAEPQAGIDPKTSHYLVAGHFPEVIQALRLLRKIAVSDNGYSSPGYGFFNDLEVGAHMLEARAAMAVIWAEWAMKLSEHISLGNEITFTQVPGGHHAVGSWMLVVPKKAKHLDDVKTFLTWVTGEKPQLCAAMLGVPPVRKRVFSDPNFTKRYKLAQKQQKALETATPRMRCKNWEEVEHIYSDLITDSLYSTGDDDTLTALLERVQTQLTEVTCQ